MCVHTRWLHRRPLPLAGGYVTELPFVIPSCYFKRWFPLQKVRQWAYVRIQKRFVFRLEMGTDRTDFYIQKINCFNECELQLCIILSKRILDGVSGGTWDTGTTSCLQKLPTAWTGQLRIPKLSQEQVRNIQTRWAHPDHDHEKKGCKFSTNAEQNSVFFSLFTSFREVLKMPQTQSS